MSEDKFLHKCPFKNCSFTSFTRPEYNAHKKIHIGDNSVKLRKCGMCFDVFEYTPKGKEQYIEHMIAAHKKLQGQTFGNFIIKKARKPVLAMVPA